MSTILACAWKSMHTITLFIVTILMVRLDNQDIKKFQT